MFGKMPTESVGLPQSMLLTTPLRASVIVIYKKPGVKHSDMLGQCQVVEEFFVDNPTCSVKLFVLSNPIGMQHSHRSTVSVKYRPFLFKDTPVKGSLQIFFQCFLHIFGIGFLFSLLKPKFSLVILSPLNTCTRAQLSFPSPSLLHPIGLRLNRSESMWPI